MRLLVLGGTGMLAPAVRRLLEDGTRVVSVSRRPDRLAPHPLLTAVAGDWADPDGLGAALRNAQRGPWTTALVWVHSAHRETVYPALDEVLADDATVVELDGSRRSRHEDETARRLLGRPPRVLRRVVLGQVVTGQGQARWLTQEEISEGALRALAGGPERQVVGALP